MKMIQSPNNKEMAWLQFQKGLELPSLHLVLNYLNNHLKNLFSLFDEVQCHVTIFLLSFFCCLIKEV